MKNCFKVGASLSLHLSNIEVGKQYHIFAYTLNGTYFCRKVTFPWNYVHSRGDLTFTYSSKNPTKATISAILIFCFLVICTLLFNLVQCINKGHSAEVSSTVRELAERSLIGTYLYS